MDTAVAKLGGHRLDTGSMTMATEHLTDALVRRLPAPERSNKITYDDTVKGFGCRVTANGHKAFVLTYTTRAGRQGRYTIGGADRWTATDARRRAKELKAEIDAGGDPVADLQAERGAPTVAALIARFREEHFPRLRSSSAEDYERMIRCHVLPHFGEHKKVTEIAFADCDALHRKITTRAKHPYRANRVLALLSKMFALAIRWGWRTDNPCKGVERNVEHNRERYLTGDEQARLNRALAEADRDVADVIRLLLLTGARRGEVLAMKWADLDITEGVWRKPPTTSKTKKVNEVPLSPPAQQILAARYVDGAEFVFPGNGAKRHVVNVHRAFRRLCKAAGITKLRIHDLRHQFASELVSAGFSLPMIGSLLGHRNPATTNRYSHLYKDVQRQAVERVGAAVMNAGQPARPPVPLRGRRSS